MRKVERNSEANNAQKVKQIVKQNGRVGDTLYNNNRDYCGVPGGIRTHDPLLRRH